MNHNASTDHIDADGRNDGGLVDVERTRGELAMIPVSNVFWRDVRRRKAIAVAAVDDARQS